MFCQHCGKEIPADSRFCEFCGKPARKTKKKIPFLFLIIIGLFAAFLNRDNLPSFDDEPAFTTSAPQTTASFAPSFDQAYTLSTDAWPSDSDFLWWNEPSDSAFWSELQETSDFESLLGGWKGLILYYGEDAGDGVIARELTHVEIGGTAVTSEIEFRLYSIQFNGEAPEDETDQAPFSGYGSFEGGLLTFSDPFLLNISYAFYHEDKQYAIGSISIENAAPADLLLVRP